MRPGSGHGRWSPAGWLLGAFVDFQWIVKPVNFLQAITILGTICFPVAAYFAVNARP